MFFEQYAATFPEKVDKLILIDSLGFLPRPVVRRNALMCVRDSCLIFIQIFLEVICIYKLLGDLR